MSDPDQEIRELYLSLSSPQAPFPTEVEPLLDPLPEIRAVVFDVYGTLICSGVGDISLSEEGNRDEVIRDLIAAQGFTINAGRTNDTDLAVALNDLIKDDHKRAQAGGTQYPEVDIVEIWKSFFTRFIEGEAEERQLRRFACEYECRVNPVWPYPHLQESIEALRSTGIPLGIVSNAQFYSPLMLEAFLDGRLSDLGFDERLLVWSFEHRLGKPSVELYEEQARRLKTSHGLTPSECLYVGNDMLKDIWAASQVGFKTVLFAGDQRSLRMRESDSRCTELKPDRVLTGLDQLSGLIDLS